MIAPGANARVYLACGATDIRKGITGLAAKAQEELRHNAASGALFAFRGRRGDRIKLFCIGMGKASAFITKCWRKAVFRGHRQLTDPRV
jgi:transposase